MTVNTTDHWATLCFVLAIAQTLSVKKLNKISHHYPPRSIGYFTFHILGEVETAFGIWAAIFLLCKVILEGYEETFRYLATRNFIEPVFVFVMMVICSSRPVLFIASKIISGFSKFIPLKRSLSFYYSCLMIGPILGSLITEPAAITVTSLILLEQVYNKRVSLKLKYTTLGLLFVNVSIGGTLTPYAAPPVLMVAKTWGWDLPFMWIHFGWKALFSIAISTGLVVAYHYQELASLTWNTQSQHLSDRPQQKLKIREGLLVAFFLAGLVVLGGPQRWWLEPLLAKLDNFSLYCGSVILTSVMDNAALTYLGSQVPHLSDASKYALVAGAVTGGGLTVIANAPNPAAYAILNPAFGEDGISPLKLFSYALLPTLIAWLTFWFL